MGQHFGEATVGEMRKGERTVRGRQTRVCDAGLEKALGRSQLSSVSTETRR